jgi:hypothetical protein
MYLAIAVWFSSPTWLTIVGVELQSRFGGLGDGFVGALVVGGMALGYLLLISLADRWRCWRLS